MRFLTAALRFSTAAARLVARSFDLTLRVLPTLAQKRNPRESWDIRCLYVSFALSFLRVDDPSVVKRALETRDFLQSIFFDLCKDSPRTLLLLLRTLREFIVSAPVPRRSKQALLRSSVLRQLGSLYSYDQPLPAPAAHGGNKPVGADSKVDGPPTQAPPSIRELAHELLLEICTTRSAGVCLPPKARPPPRPRRIHRSLYPMSP